MSEMAWLVLDDCKVVAALLEDETDSQKWRIFWASAVTLLRAVGHVLDKSGSHDAATKRASKEYFKKWKTEEEHEIFREFIEAERNLVLKEYISKVHPNDNVDVVVSMQLRSLDGAKEDKVINEVYGIPDNIYKPLLNGPWEGNDARDVLALGIKWWEKQLKAVDKRADQLRKLKMKGKHPT